MRSRSVYVITGLLVVFAAALSATEYVPPPTGPYQSSVVISGKNLFQADSGLQVYKFPSDEMIQYEPAEVGSIKQDKVYEQVEIDSPPVAKVPKAIPYSTDQNATAALPQTVNPGTAGYYANNPWAPNAQPYSNWGQNAWRNQPYMPQQQSPYGYPNQNNNMMNFPFYGMPTPWSGMPMQPFFSGK